MAKSSNKQRIFACDFETTVYKGQTYTEVWAAACVEFGSEDVKIFHSIDELYSYLQGLNVPVIAYFHNLKFDGEFWLSWLLNGQRFKMAAVKKSDGTDHWSMDDLADDFEWIPRAEMKNRTFQYSITSLGQWYRILIKSNTGKMIEFRDSMKLLPFTVERIGNSFQTKHKKLNMEYEGFRYAGCEITPEEQQYIANDVLVIKEALEIMYEEGHKKLTIGSCCLADYKSTISNSAWEDYFPDLYKYEFSPEEQAAYGSKTIGDYIRKSYRGGWCYLARGKERKVFSGGTTADVNSLYPSMMHSQSGNQYPIGLPTFWRGNLIPAEALHYNKYYFVRIRTAFYLKPGYLPFVQIKNSFLYRPNECLETSDITADGTNYYNEYTGLDGERHMTRVEMTLTQTDFELLREHYELCDFEVIDGCYFDSAIGIFDEYIDKYAAQKKTSKGARRELAKLFLNNLYGKMAASEDSSFKVAFAKEDKSLGFWTVREKEKKPGYIPVGSAITSYARNFTIRAAQANYYGPDRPGFIYADTDSIHCDLPADQLKGIVVDPVNFCCWKLEAGWDVGWYIRQKTYIEHVTEEDQEPVDPRWVIKCAGMPQRCKDLFLQSMGGQDPPQGAEYTEDEEDFLAVPRTLEDFDIGLKVPGKLMPKHIPGGILLVDTYFEMR